MQAECSAADIAARSFPLPTLRYGAMSMTGRVLICGSTSDVEDAMVGKAES
jgi:hypothetical protein